MKKKLTTFLAIIFSIALAHAEESNEQTKPIAKTVGNVIASSKACVVSHKSLPTSKVKKITLWKKIEPIFTILLGLYIMRISYKILRHPNCYGGAKYQLDMIDKLTTFILFSWLGLGFSIKGIEEAWKQWHIGLLIERWLDRYEAYNSKSAKSKT